MWLLSVTHAIHHITTLCSSSLYVTHHSACFTCYMYMYMYVHMHHANVCSVLHMLIVCLDRTTHASSLHTYTVLVYRTYMYTHSIHCLSVVYHVSLFVRCYKTKNGSLVQAFRMCTVKRHVATCDKRRFNSYHRGSVSCFEVEAGSEDECY